MTMHSDALQYLCCPLTRSPLKFVEDKGMLTSLDQQSHYPLIGSIPWIYNNTGAALSEWMGRTQALTQLFHKQISIYKQGLHQDLRGKDFTRSRLENCKQAFEHNLHTIHGLLEPTGLTDYKNILPPFQTIEERLPRHQQLNSYFTNIIRDWGLSDKENQAHFNVIKQVAPPLKDKAIATFGSGAARLSADIQFYLQPKLQFLVDINPLLSYSAHHIISGNELAFYDFATAPLTAAEATTYHICKSDYKNFDSLQFVMANALNPPFQRQSLDCVVTPWFVDINPAPLDQQMKIFNSLLTDGGYWIQFGPLAFNHQDPCENLTIEEIEEQMRNCGFKLSDIAFTEVPYLQTPASGHKRFEKVVSFSAKKTKHIPPEKAWSAYPDWIINPNKPIPINQKMVEPLQKVQIYSELLALLDGNRDLNELTQILQLKYNWPIEDTHSALVHFFCTLVDQHGPSLKNSI